MRASRLVPAVLTVGAFVVASLFAAAPASAATLPSGQKITAVDFSSWQFADASPVDAALTPVGSPVAVEGEYVTAVDVDDDGQGFAFLTTFEDDGDEDGEEADDFLYPNSSPVEAALLKADATTGILSDGMKMTISYGPEGEEQELGADECTGIDYSNGAVLGVCYNYSEGAVGYIGWVDTEDAILNAFTESSADGVGFLHFSALALDPITGTLWGFEDYYWESYQIPLDGDQPAYEAELDLPALGADFDRGGQLWITTYEPIQADRAIDPGDAGLATLDPISGVNPFEAAWSDGEFYSEAITIWGHPSLPATGPADSSVPIVGAALLLLAGTILAGVTVLRRREAD
jgi:hypothetical protein